MIKPIMTFSGKYAFLSNFFPSNIIVCGVAYPTVEHAFQAHKTLSQKERKAIATLPTPGRAKRAGRALELRSDWDEVKIPVMKTLLEKKFENPVLAERLLATGNATIMESNHWGDIFWGVSGGTGLNHLGKLLMEIRDDLKKGGE